MNLDDWPFQDLPAVPVFTDKWVIDGSTWIQYASHDLEDGAWQFHGAGRETADEVHARMITLERLLLLDPSLATLADLPPGWRAWRPTRESLWHRAPQGDG